MTVKKICAGLYQVSEGPHIVEVTYFCPQNGADFYGWVAKAD